MIDYIMCVFCLRARLVILRASVGLRILEDLELHVLGSARALPFVSGAHLGQRLFEHFDVLLFGSTRARLSVPEAPVGLRTLATPCVVGREAPRRRRQVGRSESAAGSGVRSYCGGSRPPGRGAGD